MTSVPGRRGLGWAGAGCPARWLPRALPAGHALAKGSDLGLAVPPVLPLRHALLQLPVWPQAPAPADHGIQWVLGLLGLTFLLRRTAPGVAVPRHRQAGLGGVAGVFLRTQCGSLPPFLGGTPKVLSSSVGAQHPLHPPPTPVGEHTYQGPSTPPQLRGCPLTPHASSHGCPAPRRCLTPTHGLPSTILDP